MSCKYHLHWLIQFLIVWAGDDHRIMIYYPSSAGSGMKELFRKVQYKNGNVWAKVWSCFWQVLILPTSFCVKDCSSSACGFSANFLVFFNQPFSCIESPNGWLRMILMICADLVFFSCGLDEIILILKNSRRDVVI